jgi:hypothetical protein
LRLSNRIESGERAMPTLALNDFRQFACSAEKMPELS